MSRAVLFVGLLLVGAGMGLFVWKTVGHELPLVPTDSAGPWNVEIQISVRGDGRRGSVRAMLPKTDVGQVVFDERSSSDRMAFSIREQPDHRTGVWTGWIEDIHEIVYEFRVQSQVAERRIPDTPADEPVPSALKRRYTRPSADFPASAPEITGWIQEMDLPAPRDLAGRVRTIYAFVSHEIATVPSAGGDAILTLSRREGDAEGKERLLVTLLRGAGIPARTVRALALEAKLPPEERVFSEVYANDRWVPMSTVEGFFESLPGNWIVLGPGEKPLVEATGVRAVGHRLRSRREQLRPDEIANMLAPDNRVLAWMSLYRLPIGAQNALRILLLLPVGALMAALFRNGVGVPTYGTFMPVLIALALRESTLGFGIALVVAVIVIGVIGRLALERLRLLMVPRLSIQLCLVVLAVTCLALLGRDLELTDLFAASALPIVILTMLIERISITIAEEGAREASIRGFWSVLVAGAIFPVFRSAHVEYLMFSFPELVIAVMGVLVWVGGYTGYRVADFVRFRLLLREGVEPA